MKRGVLAALVTLALVACNDDASAPVQTQVTGFTLLDAYTGEALTTTSLTDGSSLASDTLPEQLRVQATTNPEAVGSVRFTLGDRSFTDDTAPYVLEPLTPTPGDYTLTATPYSAAGAGGAAGRPLSVSFTVTAPEAEQVEDPEGYRRLMYVFRRGAPNLYVYDMDNSYKLVKTRTLRELREARTWGAVADAKRGVLYLSHHNRDTRGRISPGVLAYDLVTERVLWRREYRPFIDSLEITPDGKTLYMATGEATERGDFWYVLNAADGSVKGKIPVYRGAHNTIVGLSGEHVYMASVRYPYLAVADTATNKVIQRIGPMRAGVRPFTVNGAETLAFVNVNRFLGFEIGDIKTGKKLYSVPVRGFPSANFDELLDVQSHGVALTPDEREAWVVDGTNRHLHIFDVTGLPGKAPVQKESIALRAPPLWIAFSRDGRFAHVSTGDVIDAKTRKVVAKTALSKIRLQIDFVGDKPVAAYSRYGLGYVTPPN